MTDSAGGLGMSDLKFMGHAAGMTNIEVAQSLEYNAPHAPSATATAVMETAAWRLRVLHLILTGPAARRPPAQATPAVGLARTVIGGTTGQPTVICPSGSALHSDGSGELRKHRPCPALSGPKVACKSPRCATGGQCGLSRRGIWVIRAPLLRPSLRWT